MKKQLTPLIIEQHPKEYEGFPFITLIQYHKTSMLCIVDNSDASNIRTFVLDMCGPAEVDEEAVITAAAEWHTSYASQYPVSVHFTKVGISHLVSKIFRTLSIEHVSRAIGPVPKYPMIGSGGIRRRKRKSIPPNVLILGDMD